MFAGVCHSCRILLHYVEAVEDDDDGVRQRLLYGGFERCPHVHGDGLDAVGHGLIQRIEARHQAGLRPTFGDPYQTAGIQVVDHRQIIVALGAGDLVDAQVPQAVSAPGSSVGRSRCNARSSMALTVRQAGVACECGDAHCAGPAG